jgi:Ca2+-binding EF-hand superfamily protein
LAAQIVGVDAAGVREIQRLLGNIELKRIQELHNKWAGQTSDGTLDKDQFLEAFKSFPVSQKLLHHPEFMDYMFEMFDVKGDGKIDFAEWTSMLVRLSNSQDEDKLDEAFKVIDSDKDGRLTPEDMHKFVKGFFGSPAQIAEFLPDFLVAPQERAALEALRESNEAAQRYHAMDVVNSLWKKAGKDPTSNTDTLSFEEFVRVCSAPGSESDDELGSLVTFFRGLGEDSTIVKQKGPKGSRGGWLVLS